MEKILKSVQWKFRITIILLVIAIVCTSWLSLQLYNNNEIAAPASKQEIERSAQSNEALSTYIKEQQAFEAHFITLASDIKQQEAERITRALATTTVIVLVAGVAIAIIIAKRLIQPVEDAYRSQERFIQDAAHELRNPLATLTVTLQQTDQHTKKTALYLTAKRQVKRLINITEDLLFLEKNPQHTQTKRNLSDLFLDVIEELQPIARARNITIQAHTESHIYKTIVTEEYVRALKNIVENAVKYSKNGGNVSVSQVRKRHTITIVVKDEGIGIPKSDMKRIGDRFFRASNTGSIDGSGLGIAIVQKIIRKNNGSFHISSQKNKGTIVTLRIPA